ncbi:HAD family hydrolase [Candidatus Thiothrix anitrata]|uniref:Sucrose phosphatase-like domain-containing protein n=1 Tax=Candidatus Thiothrix anitrata TaxID=2823902 RepID=A0ABX7X088_9GAMM|nr:hypothetical protein [Candidatus Thiothrix anitrata]QTR49374.1 hypothetical protein J8380_14125 [Candidatus Thiothrix anitrata]
MKPLLLTDLDDTLFQTARKMPADTDKIPAAQGLNGDTISFMHPWQHDFIHWALACMQVIPVTARGIESFQRVHLPFQHQAVCVHGAAILTRKARWMQTGIHTCNNSLRLTKPAYTKCWRVRYKQVKRWGYLYAAGWNG